VIDIEKRSGCNRQKSEDKRIAAIRAECDKQGHKYEDYLRWIVEAREQWYKKPDGTIFIPRHHVAGALVQTIGGAPKALRGVFNKDNFRALVQIGDFATTKTAADGVFGRFVKLEGSNQRSWQENEYIGEYIDVGGPFVASGAISIADPKHEQTVHALLRSAVETVGIGAARKMGFGRGVIVSWDGESDGK
jgi:hypothetical protein